MKVSVIVHPGAKNPRVDSGQSRLRSALNQTLSKKTEGFGGQSALLHVYVSQPPLDGRANEAVIKALADYFSVKKYQVRLLRGEKSKNKIFDVEV